MRRKVGVRELRARTSGILRRVRERREAVDITYRGLVIARIVPVPPRAEAEETLSAVWTDIDRLAGEIGAHSKRAGKNGAEAASEGGRG